MEALKTILAEHMGRKWEIRKKKNAAQKKRSKLSYDEYKIST